MSAPRVLIVDDDALQRELACRALTSGGLEVAAAAGLEDVARLAAELSPDVVLVDVNLPGAPAGAAVEIARRAVPAGVRVLLFSADDEGTLRALARRVKADGWISKSTSVVELSTMIRTLLAR